MPEEQEDQGGVAAFLIGLLIIFWVLKWLFSEADNSK